MFSFLFFKAAAFNAESEPIKVATIVKGRDAAQAYCEVLDHVASVIVHPTPQKKQHLTVLSKKVAHSVGELVKSAEELKGIYIVIIFLFIYLFSYFKLLHSVENFKGCFQVLSSLSLQP